MKDVVLLENKLRRLLYILHVVVDIQNNSVTGLLGVLYSQSKDQIEYAAEIALEHHLGLTCDPICGLVQIPCIERNAVAAMRAINAVDLAKFLYGTRKIALDNVIKTMKQTGLDIKNEYKETGEGGLAKLII